MFNLNTFKYNWYKYFLNILIKTLKLKNKYIIQLLIKMMLKFQFFKGILFNSNLKD